MWLRIVLWIGTIAMMVLLFTLSSPLREAGVASIEVLEMSGKSEAKEIIDSWKQHNLVDVALLVIYVDFLFILFYVPLMIISTRDQLKVETTGVLCMLLMLNTPLAILTGILDVIENIIMTRNISAIGDHLSTVIISILKFAAAGWVILLWLFVLIRRKVIRQNT
jgi:hypothetical protein